MSWMPSDDPVLGDPKTCDALELIIVPRTRDLGDGFAVRRALPHGKRQMVGPFIFFDHFGPVQFVSGKGMDVRPHPHIGLATVTYLFDGSIMHRDSEGNIQEITPGAMNLMTAGRGIAHSERTPDLQRREGQKMLGLQSWIALPAGKEEIAPSFQHYAAGDLPMITERGFTARVIAGSSFGIASPVEMVSPWFYTEVTTEAGASVPLDADHEERAIYLVDGEVEIANERYEGPKLLIFRPGDRITVKAIRVGFALDTGTSLVGFYVDHWGWQWLYWQSVMVAPLMGLMVYLGTPREPINRKLLRDADWGGMLLLGTSVAMIYAGLDQGNRLDWLESGAVMALLLGGGVLFIGFLINETLVREPWAHVNVLFSRNVGLRPWWSFCSTR